MNINGAENADEVCMVCLEAPVNKHTLACGHGGCFDCLCRAATAGPQKCPMCRADLTVADLGALGVANVRIVGDWMAFIIIIFLFVIGAGVSGTLCVSAADMIMSHPGLAEIALLHACRRLLVFDPTDAVCLQFQSR